MSRAVPSEQPPGAATTRRRGWLERLEPDADLVAGWRFGPGPLVPQVAAQSRHQGAPDAATRQAFADAAARFDAGDLTGAERALHRVAHFRRGTPDTLRDRIVAAAAMVAEPTAAVRAVRRAARVARRVRRRATRLAAGRGRRR